MSPRQVPCLTDFSHTIKVFKSSKDLLSPTTTSHKYQTCSICEKSIVFRHFKSHLQTHLEDEERQKFKCSIPLCTKEYYSRQKLKLHVAQIHSGSFTKFECRLCNSSFSTKKGRDVHVVAIHTGEKAYQCKECPSKFSTTSGLYSHGFTHSEEKPHKCSACSKPFKTISRLRMHKLKVHSTSKDFCCTICAKKFTTKSYLKTHLKTHNKEQFPCYFCKKAFAQAWDRNRHLKIHTEEKPFLCPVESCQYSCANLTNLKKHEKLHHPLTDGSTIACKAVSCYFCSKQFPGQSHLVRHLRSHTLEEPFPCSLCQSSFTTNEGLRSHIFSHTKEKPLRCPHCRKCFSNGGGRNRHIAAVHLGEKRFFCEFCSHSTFRKQGMSKHQTKCPRPF